MRSLNLDQLRALGEVVRLGSFSAAARHLNLSQPAVSLQVRELEARAGVRLVERMGKRAFATAAGRELIEHGGRLAAEAERALVTMRRHREGWLGRVRIGTSFWMLNYLLPPILKRLRAAHPDLELGISLGSSAIMVERLLRNDIDLGIVTLPAADPHLDVTVLRHGQIIGILPASITAPKRLRPSDFLRWPLILDSPGSRMGRIIRDWLAGDAPSGEGPRPVMEIGDTHAIRTLVAAGLGVSIMPLDALGSDRERADIVQRPLDPPLSLSIGLVQRRDKPEDAALAIVREALLELRKRPGPERRQEEPRPGPARRSNAPPPGAGAEARRR